MKKLLIVLISVPISFILFGGCSKKHTSFNGKIKYIVFTDAYFWDMPCNNKAILITDKETIYPLAKMYENKLLREFKNGSNYHVHFFDKNNKHIYNRMIQSETDVYSRDHKEIDTVIQQLVNKIKHSPTHYIFNLKVSVNNKSDSVIKLLKQNGFEAFLLSQQNKQYPSIKLMYCEPRSNGRSRDDAEERYKEILRKIKWNNTPIDSSNFYRTTTDRAKQVDYETNKVAQTYYFPNTTNIDSIINRINDMQIDYLFAEPCAQYYYIQLLSPQEELDTSSLQKKYPFIEDVCKVEYGFVYEECDRYD